MSSALKIIFDLCQCVGRYLMLRRTYDAAIASVLHLWYEFHMFSFIEMLWLFLNAQSMSYTVYFDLSLSWFYYKSIWIWKYAFFSELYPENCFLGVGRVLSNVLHRTLDVVVSYNSVQIYKIFLVPLMSFCQYLIFGVCC